MKKIDHLSESVFAANESRLTGIDGHNGGYTVDLHGPAKAPKVPALGSAPLSPGRRASVEKAAAASVAKRRSAAAMKPRKGFGF